MIHKFRQMVVSLLHRYKALSFKIDKEIWKTHDNDESSIALRAN